MFLAAKPGTHRVYTELSCCRAGSLMDTNSLEAMMEQGRPARRRPAPVNGTSNSRPAVNGRPGNGILDSHVISTHGELWPGQRAPRGSELSQLVSSCSQPARCILHGGKRSPAL